MEHGGLKENTFFRVNQPSVQRHVETTSNDRRDQTAIDDRVMVRNASLLGRCVEGGGSVHIV